MDPEIYVRGGAWHWRGVWGPARFAAGPGQPLLRGPEGGGGSPGRAYFNSKMDVF